MGYASFKVLKGTGTTPLTETDTSKNPCFLGGSGGDIHSIETSDYPIPIPSTSGATACSWECYVRWELVNEPDNKVEDPKWWGHREPLLDSGLVVYVGTTNSPSQPTNSISTIATTISHDHYYNSDNSLTITCSTDSGHLATSGQKTIWLVMQDQVYSSATQGDVPTFNGYLGYAES